MLDGTKINEQLSYKKIKLLEMRKNYICERRTPLLIGASPDVPVAI
jgi:N6-L-threonylcarbamoyladenine synthase